jgi:integrase
MTLTYVRRELRLAQANGRPRERLDPKRVEDPMPTLGKHFDEALRLKVNLRPITREGYERIYNNHIHEPFGNLPVDEITRKSVTKWAAELSERGLSPATVAGIVRTLRMVLGIAVDWDLIARNPAARLRLSAPDFEQAPAQKVLTPVQLETLLNHPGNTLRVETMERAAAQAGLRRAELCGARWGDVDFDRNVINVRRGYNGGPTKGKRARAVPMPAILADRLREWRDESVGATGVHPDAYVWPGRDGAEMAPHTPTQAHARAMERAGLIHERGTDSIGAGKGRRSRAAPRPIVTLHGLRHTYVSTLLAKGAALIDVARAAGHSSPAITAAVYAHLLDDDQLAYLGELIVSA